MRDMLRAMSTTLRTALVTGANRGLGRETARQLAGRGFHVIVTSREVAAARASARTLAFDVADADGIATAADHLREAATTIDVLVNNAGIAMDGFNADVARRT